MRADHWPVRPLLLEPASRYWTGRSGAVTTTTPRSSAVTRYADERARGRRSL